MFLIFKPSWLLACGAAALMSIAAPAHAAYPAPGMVFFEDLWPSNGDQDFNDQAVSYNYSDIISNGKVTGMHATFNVLAIGSAIHNGLYLHLPVPSAAIASTTLDLGLGSGPVNINLVANESQPVIQIVPDTRTLYNNATGFINTSPGVSSRTGSTVQLDVQFAAGATPVRADLAPFDLFIARSGDYTHQIHLPQFGGTDQMDQTLFNTANDNSSPNGPHFVNAQGSTFALAVPQIIVWPAEGVAIDLAYPDIDSYFASGGILHTDWYRTNVHPQYLYSSAVPEPGSLMLLAISGTALTRRRRHGNSWNMTKSQAPNSN